MSKITVTSRQSLLDISVQHSGSLEALFDIAIANGISITDDLAPCTLLDIPRQKETSVVRYYEVNRIMPATAISIDDVEGLGGINYMRIEYDFIIS